MAKPVILVTGSTGFVGPHFVRRLDRERIPYRIAVRAVRPPGMQFGAVSIDDWSSVESWKHSWPRDVQISAVVHLAGLAHVMGNVGSEVSNEFRRVNVDYSVALATAAAEMGVSRFVYVSSIKVHGESTQLGTPFRATDAFAPVDVYGRSKAEAEECLAKVCERTGLVLTVVRPPLVHGPNPKGNLASLVRLLKKRVPLPLALATGNRRSLVGVENLSSLLETCALSGENRQACYLVSDDFDVSTAELLLRMGRALESPARLVAVPLALMNGAANVLRRRAEVDRLLGSLQLDIEPTKSALGWIPPRTLDDGLKQLG